MNRFVLLLNLIFPLLCGAEMPENEIIPNDVGAEYPFGRVLLNVLKAQVRDHDDRPQNERAHEERTQSYILLQIIPAGEVKIDRIYVELYDEQQNWLASFYLYRIRNPEREIPISLRAHLLPNAGTFLLNCSRAVMKGDSYINIQTHNANFVMRLKPWMGD